MNGTGYAMTERGGLSGRSQAWYDAGGEKKWLTVSELNGYVKALIDSDDVLSTLAVRGEISNFKHHYSGHLYFSLKDGGGIVKCVMFSSAASKLKADPADGDDVIVYGRLSVFPRDGAYQLYVTALTQAGAGELKAAFERMKKKLAAEGLFDESRKKKIPVFPERIGIVTSPVGAAVQDMLSIIGRRYPPAEILLYPAVVQGSSAPGSIIGGINYFNRELRADVIIIGRGGGSEEDLFCFNDEALARTIAASEVPVISAVGHETDFTISDFVADLRAPTPSAAAELAVPDSSVLARRLRDSERRMTGSVSSRLDYLEARLSAAANAPVLRSPGRYIDLLTDELMSLASRNDAAAAAVIEAAGSKLRVGAAKLEAMSPLAVLVRGYSAVTKGGRVVSSAASLRTGDAVRIRMSDGSADAVITDTGTPEHT